MRYRMLTLLLGVALTVLATVAMLCYAQERFDDQGRPLEGTDKDKVTQPEVAEYFNAQGERISEKEARELAAAKGRAKACLKLYNGPTGIWKIDVTFDPNTYPYVITGGTIKGTICGSPHWIVTGGSMGPNLLINAKRTKGPASCPNTVTIVGSFQNPLSYTGTYGFNGTSTSFPHTTLYCCNASAP